MKSIRACLRGVAVTGALAIGVFAFAGSASAAADPAPGTGLIGACNMLSALGVGANGGLANALSTNNANGLDGKWHAVAESGCPLRP